MNASAWLTFAGVACVLAAAQQLRLADAHFDRTLSLLVLNFVPDSARAMKEMVRVTRPGGVVFAAVWDYGEGLEMLRVFWDAAVALDPAVGRARRAPHAALPARRAGRAVAQPRPRRRLGGASHDRDPLFRGP